MNYIFKYTALFCLVAMTTGTLAADTINGTFVGATAANTAVIGGGVLGSGFENWGFNNNRAYLFLGFSILSVFMALFRRHFRKKYSNKN